MAMKDMAFTEYISSLRQISISEDIRISHGSENMRKRRRVAQHYLTRGKMKLTPEDISLLCKGDSTIAIKEIKSSVLHAHPYLRSYVYVKPTVCG
ncbi:unnamed protein product [Sphenostylis stenocarpa]|uniref:Uncharacterized protein n=1 Tax=Sphenostylis stenocarpa TaxID=92480 RepID=A0AA86VNL7_9FABA|nr:unnamed protein product [Sphenostylis stenocarpa]